MADLGIPELLIILAIVLVLFGPARIAGMGKTLGLSIREFRQSMRDETANSANPAPQGEPPDAETDREAKPTQAPHDLSGL